jgi:hypothetical protein
MSVLEMQAGEMLAREFAGGQVLNILWNQPGRFLKFVKSLV